MITNLVDIPYINFPNPRFRREKYQIIDGEATISFFDNENDQLVRKSKILLPFSYETKKSGINIQKMYKHIEYDWDFTLSNIGTYLIHFGAVDYHCFVYINDIFVGEHVGGFTAFSFDISSAIKVGKNHIRVIVYDSFCQEQLRGKQRSRDESYECWYVQTTGIYKSVYIERCGSTYVKKALLNGDQNGNFTYQIDLNKKSNISIEIFDQGTLIKRITCDENNNYCGTIHFDTYKLWSEKEPFLYDVKIVVDGKEKDEVMTYFAFRSITASNGKLLLNNQSLFLKMVLNQGYYSQQGLTLTKADIIKDFALMKEFGFNGCRIHQKIEDHLLYYLADVMGFYLWSELPSCYQYSENSKKEIQRDLQIIIDQNYNSPSILTYVIFNESWGIPEISINKEVQEYVKDLTIWVKQYDSTRLVVSNDGWNNIETTDIVSLHDYEQDADRLYDEYKDKNYVINGKIINKYGPAFVKNHVYKNQPIIISEFGGVALQCQDGWGYGDKASDLEILKLRMQKLFDSVYHLDYLSGFCYCQLSDVEQEINGLVTSDRKNKLSIEVINDIVKGVKV